jgi:small-conductance mechanosensitive channel
MEQVIETAREWLSLVGPNPLLRAGVIVVVSVILAKIVEWVLCGVIGRLVKGTKTDMDDRLIQALHRPVFVSVVLVGLGLATLQLKLNATVEWATLAFLKTIAVVLWMVFTIRFVTLLLHALSRNRERFEFIQDSTVPLLDTVSKVVVVGGAIYFVCLCWNVDVTAWLMSAGIIGIALGLAAKDTLANLFSGMFIMADAPYKIGDYIILDGGERGVVTRIGMRSTRLLTRDDVEITIPNAVMGNSKIINESGGPHEKERLRVQVSVAYGSDVDKVRDVLNGIARSHKEICKDPEPRVRFRRFGDSGLDFELLAWIEEPVLRGKLLDAMNMEVYKAFAEEGIEIPYPKRDVYIKEMPTATPPSSS